MTGKKILVSIILMVIAFSCTISIPASAVDILVNAAGGDDAVSLDNALEIADDGDTIVLHSDINLTKSLDNITAINKDVDLQSNGYTIFLNGTLVCGKGAAPHSTLTLRDDPTFVYQHQYSVFHNASLIQMLNGFHLVGVGPIRNKTVWVDTRESPFDAVNITGNGNLIEPELVISSNFPANPRALNISGSGNKFIDSTGGLHATEYGICIIGNDNEISFNSTEITAPLGKVYLAPGTTDNVIDDDAFDENTPLTITIYNGTVPRGTSAWYFFNNSESPHRTNMNVTIDVPRVIPLVGQVGLSAILSNVTANPSDITYTQSLTIINGCSGGLIRDTTENTIFAARSAEVPVHLNFTGNEFAGHRDSFTLGTIKILNFNPAQSLPGKNINETLSTNLADIVDFTHVSNVTFVADGGPGGGYTLWGSIKFNDDIDLTDPGVIAALSDPATGPTFDPSGNGVDFHIPAAAASALSKPATLTVYPGFPFASGNDISITGRNDAGGESMFYNKGQWYGKTDFVAANQNVTVGHGFISLPVLKPTMYRFAPGWTPAIQYHGGGGSGSDSNSVPPPASSSLGMSAVSAAAAPRPAVAKSQITVNVGGNSAITSAEVTGVGISNLILTSTARHGLPATAPSLAGPVYQVMEVVPARATEVSSAKLTFTVPSAWLDENHISKKDIALMVNDGRTWNAAPTEIMGEKDGKVIYQGWASHFPSIAIAFQKNAATQSLSTSASSVPAVKPALTSVVKAPPQQTAAQPLAPKSKPSEASIPSTDLKCTTTTVPAFEAPGFGFPWVVAAIVLIGLGFALRKVLRKA
jgi:PGF-pre-PGF domain-containing protein